MHAVVKSVISGDSLIVMGQDASKGPPPEKLVTLSGIIAPRLGNRNGGADQPFAWAAREFLRQTAIGKRCSFAIDSAAAPQAGQKTREFGTVFVDEVSLAAKLVEAGFAKVKPVAEAHRTAEYEELLLLAQAAEDAGRGMYGSSPTAVRNVQWAGTFDVGELVKRSKGQRIPAVVEQVPSGSAMRVMLLPGFEQVTVILSGIQCPPIRRLEDGSEEAAPFSREARYFVECRLLNRDVTVKLEGLDKNGTAFGTVLHPAGNVSVLLVQSGFAKVVDYSATLTDNAAELRAAEKGAKQKRLRIWHDYVPPNAGVEMGEAQVKVVEVVSGDTLMVTEIGGGAEKRISLSSIRAPRILKDNSEPWALEAKEFLRKTLIGKKVKLAPEFRKTFTQENGATFDRTFASIFLNEKNIAMMLVEAGLVEVDKRGSTDEKSEYFDLLCEAETAAMSAKKGKYGGSPKGDARPTDLTIPAAKERAGTFLRSLQRGGKVRATVQFVVNGARFKLTLPKENLLITFSLVGLRCPACARRDGGGGDGEPFGDEAYAFTRGLAFQRDVEIEVEAVDKGGAFLGSLFLPDKRNLGVALLQAGLSARFGPAADRSTYGEEMWRAEEAAQKANLKVWEGYSAEKAAAEKAEAEAAREAEEEATPDSQKPKVALMLTEIIDGAHFYAHIATDEDALTSLQAQLANTRLGNGYEPSNGAVVAAKFTQDDVWYRAKVVKKEKGSFTVFFVDYGNSDVVTKERLAPLDPTIGLQAVSAQAMECRLACTTVASPEEGDGLDALNMLGDDAWGKPVMARVDDRQGGTLHVTLFDASGDSVNEKLVSAGLARAEKKPLKRFATLAAALQKKEEEAKASRSGMWRYGDIDEDDAKEFGFQRPPPQPAPAKGAWGKK